MFADQVEQLANEARTSISADAHLAIVDDPVALERPARRQGEIRRRDETIDLSAR